MLPSCQHFIQYISKRFNVASFLFNIGSGLPMFAASIGVVRINSNNQAEVVAGVVYNPVLDEMTSAVRSRGW
jgi:hypothetical protein